MDPILKTIIILCCFVSLIHTRSHAQGAWNIKYVPTSSVDSTFIGKEIRFDFKKDVADSIQRDGKPISGRNMLSKEDTVKLVIGDDTTRFVEEWKIYADHGVISEQLLQCIEPGQDEVWIKEFYIKSMSRLYFTVEAVIF